MNSCLFVVLRFHREDKVTDPCQLYEIGTMGDINGKIISRRRTPNSQKSTFFIDTYQIVFNSRFSVTCFVFLVTGKEPDNSLFIRILPSIPKRRKRKLKRKEKRYN